MGRHVARGDHAPARGDRGDHALEIVVGVEILEAREHPGVAGLESPALRGDLSILKVEQARARALREAREMLERNRLALAQRLAFAALQAAPRDRDPAPRPQLRARARDTIGVGDEQRARLPREALVRSK